MCRLGGVVLSNRPRTTEQYQNMAEDLLMLLVNMEEAYGGDGVSMTFHYPNGSYRIIKEHRKVNRVFHKFNEIQKNLMDGAIIVQMHARLSTCGPSKHHENMHPFVHGEIVGCHNGQIEDDLIWKELEHFDVFPYSTTDSEAIFAALSVYSPSLHPRDVQTVLDSLLGTYAITAVDTEIPNMLFMVRGVNPLCYWHNKKRGELWYASTPDLLPETLNIPRKKVKRKYTSGKNKGKSYKVSVRNIVELDEGDGLYIRSHRKHVSIEKHHFDVGAIYANPRYWGENYGYTQYAEDWDAWDDEEYLTEQEQAEYANEYVQTKLKGLGD